jgi:hypothetical protein
MSCATADDVLGPEQPPDHSVLLEDVDMRDPAHFDRFGQAAREAETLGFLWSRVSWTDTQPICTVVIDFWRERPRNPARGVFPGFT